MCPIRIAPNSFARAHASGYDVAILHWAKTMFHDADSEIRNELLTHERLLWTGQPRQGIVLRGFDVFMIPFSILWGGFAIFWMVMAVTMGAPWFFVLFGTPFVLVGLYMIFGRFWVEARMRAHTFYGLTEDRVIIVSGIYRRQAKSLNLDTITDVTLTEYRNGGGLITFGPTLQMFAALQGTSWPGMSQFLPPSFALASDARAVYQRINEARAKRRGKEDRTEE
jgi:hypothetical protein